MCLLSTIKLADHGEQRNFIDALGVVKPASRGGQFSNDPSPHQLKHNSVFKSVSMIVQ